MTKILAAVAGFFEVRLLGVVFVDVALVAVLLDGDGGGGGRSGSFSISHRPLLRDLHVRHALRDHHHRGRHHRDAGERALAVLLEA